MDATNATNAIDAMPARIAGFLADRHPPTPCLVLDLDVVAERCSRLRHAFPDAPVHYAVKANAEPRVIELLARVGAGFDVASPAEIDRCVRAGVSPDRLSYGNTIKKRADIRHAHELGIRRFSFDADGELDKLAAEAPGASVLCRLATSGAGADWPLSGKFGCDAEMAVELLLSADRLGLDAEGVAFHVGSQQRDPSQWDDAIAEASVVFAKCQSSGLRLRMLDLGGGFPAHYLDPVPPIEDYSRAIRASLARHFGPPSQQPQLMIEPGRFVVADAGVLHTEVVLVSRKSSADEHRWVYVDAGVFGGLAETLGEAITYNIITSRDQDNNNATGPVVLAGPTCDSLDVLYERHRYRLPLALEAGDTVTFLSAGAYTNAYCTDGFNGFGPLDVYCVP
jgi:ornithine decarboxylase